MAVMMAIQDFEESEKMRFERKVAIVTGGNSGIGKEVARRFVAEGGRVVVNPIVDEVRRKLGDGLRFVFRNFPLTEMHPHAEHAAEIAEATATHNKFWEMHDMLYAHQDALDDRHLAEYATLLGVPASEVKHALAEHAYLDRVREDFMSGVRSGVNGTPTFFINGVRHDGSYDRESLLAAIADAAR